MTGFGLAQIKQEGMCNDYGSGVSFDPFAVKFKSYYEDNHIKWYHRFLSSEIKRTLYTKYYMIWKEALSCNAKAKL